MKAFTISFLSLVVVALLLAGCGEKSSQPETKSGQPTQPTNAPSTSGSIATAPVDYLAGLAKAQQSAVKSVDLTSLNKDIQLFNVQEGRYPKDLNELVEKHYIPEIPPVPYGSKLDYDPNTGSVKIVKQ